MENTGFNYLTEALWSVLVAVYGQVTSGCDTSSDIFVFKESMDHCNVSIVSQAFSPLYGADQQLKGAGGKL